MCVDDFSLFFLSFGLLHFDSSFFSVFLYLFDFLEVGVLPISSSHLNQPIIIFLINLSYDDVKSIINNSQDSITEVNNPFKVA